MSTITLSPSSNVTACPRSLFPSLFNELGRRLQSLTLLSMLTNKEKCSLIVLNRYWSTFSSATVISANNTLKVPILSESTTPEPQSFLGVKGSWKMSLELNLDLGPCSRNAKSSCSVNGDIVGSKLESATKPGPGQECALFGCKRVTNFWREYICTQSSGR